jgi:hypothetical protein
MKKKEIDRKKKVVLFPHILVVAILTCRSACVLVTAVVVHN